ncbi:MAG: hypothetical protein RMK64_07595 [Rhodovarius sp.]|nr:hypothetical protein [Rhodovarius sp.]MCX7931642.1 hypothetical protein [Rhodovarius sp.]MDW8314818.1 hypothetical protein [Rhodovarius sp.]
MTDKPLIFADGIQDASVHHAVARITFGRLAGDGKAEPAGLLVVPLVQLPGIANAMVALVRQIEQKLKDAQAQQAAARADQAPKAEEGGTMPGAFTFGSR